MNITERISNTLTINPGKCVMTLSESPSLWATTSASSGIATRITAPSITPGRLEMPAKTAPVTRANERESVYAPGETRLMVIAKTAPAKPAKAELMVKAKTFILAE